MKRDPLTPRALAALAVAAVVDLVVVLGVPVPVGLEAAIVGVVGAGTLVYLVVAGKRKVTPVADPRGNDGVPLVRQQADDGSQVRRDRM